jgi:hypothetical protein
MEINSNERLIKRNARIGQITSITGLAVLAGGMILSFTRPEMFTISLVALLVGFGLSQIGIYFGNRWGRSPRPDEVLNDALKGLDGRYSIYHYTTPTSHLLVGPAGIWVLMPRHQGGTITYDDNKKRWRQKGGNLYLKIFAQESLGRPELEIGTEINAVTTFLEERVGENKLPEVSAVLVMTNEKCVVDADNAPAPTLEDKKLKDFVRKTAKGKPISLDLVREIQDSIGGD